MTLKRGEPPEVDTTLQHPRCVFQILKRHFSRYTPEMVEQICGVPKEQFLEVAEALCANSGRERTCAFVYSVGWTQHTVGVQYIRTAAIIQLLLGNIGRPGGGILALRGHANIQGSTDIPTLFNILPGYIPMPHPPRARDLDDVRRRERPRDRRLGALTQYVVSLLQAWWGDARDGGERLLLRLPAAHRRRPLELRDDVADARRRVPGLLRRRARTPRSAPRTGGSSAGDGEASTGSWCATCRRSSPPRSGTTGRRSSPAS